MVEKKRDFVLYKIFVIQIDLNFIFFLASLFVVKMCISYILQRVITFSWFDSLFT